MSNKKLKLFIGALLIFAIGAMLVILYLDSSQKADRRVGDTKKQIEAEIIAVQLQLYYEENITYPESLDEIEIDLTDTISLKLQQYFYRPLHEKQRFEICVDFETKGNECLNSEGNWVPDFRFE